MLNARRAVVAGMLAGRVAKPTRRAQSKIFGRKTRVRVSHALWTERIDRVERAHRDNETNQCDVKPAIHTSTQCHRDTIGDERGQISHSE
jgi:hypothetical protein